MKTQNKNPILICTLWTLFFLVFPIATGVISGVLALNGTQIMLVQGIGIWIAFAVALLYILKSPGGLHGYMFQMVERKTVKRVLFFIPIIAILAMRLAFGVRSLSVSYVLIAAFFTISVGFAEETYFRAIIIHVLRSKFSVKKAIILSTLFFGLAHISTFLIGANIMITLLTVVNALVFGFVAAELVAITKSIWPVIIWHFGFDFFNRIGAEIDFTQELIVGTIQVVIMIVTAIILWHKLSSTKEV